MKREIAKPFKRTIRVLSNCWVRCDFLCFTTRLLAWSSQPPVTKVSDGFNCPCTWGIHRTFEILWPTYSATVSPTFAIAKDFLCTWRANYRLRSSSPLSSYIQTRLNYMKKIPLKLHLGTTGHRRLRTVFKMASFEKAKKRGQNPPLPVPCIAFPVPTPFSLADCKILNIYDKFYHCCIISP